MTHIEPRDQTEDILRHNKPWLKNRKRSILSRLLGFSAYALFLCIIVGLTALVVFYMFFQPQPQISVPNIVGKSFVEGAILLQKKKLYSRIALQYTADPLDKGIIVKQDPAPGMVVREQREIKVIVSRGVAIAKVPNYKGKLFSEVQSLFSDQFAGVEELFSTPTVTKIFDNSATRTIIAQDPLPGSKITGKNMALHLIVSRGRKDLQEVVQKKKEKGDAQAQEAKKIMPDMTGLYFNDMYPIIESFSLPVEFYISERNVVLPTESQNDKKENGIIIEHVPAPGAEITANSKFRIGLRSRKNQEETTQHYEVGILSFSLPQYASYRTLDIYKFPISNEKNKKKEITLRTRGGQITIPYYKTPNVSYEAVINNSSVWRYSLPDKDSR